MTEQEETCTRHVLWYFGQEGGWSYGNFTEHLLRAWQGADPSNRAKLALGFPEYAGPMNLVLDTMDGIKVLQRRLEQDKK